MPVPVEMWQAFWLAAIAWTAILFVRRESGVLGAIANLGLWVLLAFSSGSVVANGEVYGYAPAQYFSVYMVAMSFIALIFAAFGLWRGSEDDDRAAGEVPTAREALDPRGMDRATGNTGDFE